MKGETIIDNEIISVKTTGRDYDFIATIENKSEDCVNIIIANENSIIIKGFDWVGLLADDEGYYLLENLKNGNYEVE